MFHPTPGPVPLDDPGRWWAYVPGVNWRHPWGPSSDNSERQDHPVTHVAYEDAEAFAAWAGKVLPTEAEWEYAARGGLEGSTFAWGDEHRPEGELMANSWQGDFPWRNTGAKGWRGTSPVGLFPANGYGLYDMTGNVWEWTTDYYSPRGAGAKQTGSPCCTPPRNPRIGSPERKLRLRTARCAHSPPGDQGRLAPVRTHLLPALPASGPPTRSDRYLNKPHRLPLHPAIDRPAPPSHAMPGTSNGSGLGEP